MDKKMVKKFNIAMYIFIKMVILYFFVFVYQGCSLKKIKTGIDTCEVVTNKIVYDTIVVKQTPKIIELPTSKDKSKVVNIKITELKTGKTITRQILKDKVKLIDTTKFKVVVIYEQRSSKTQNNTKK